MEGCERRGVGVQAGVQRGDGGVHGRGPVGRRLGLSSRADPSAAVSARASAAHYTGYGPHAGSRLVSAAARGAPSALRRPIRGATPRLAGPAVRETLTIWILWATTPSDPSGSRPCHARLRAGGPMRQQNQAGGALREREPGAVLTAARDNPLTLRTAKAVGFLLRRGVPPSVDLPPLHKRFLSPCAPRRASASPRL